MATASPEGTYFGTDGGGSAGGCVGTETLAERSKNRNSSAASWALSEVLALQPSGSVPVIPMPPAWRSVNTALPQYRGPRSAFPASATVEAGAPPMV